MILTTTRLISALVLSAIAATGAVSAYLAEHDYSQTRQQAENDLSGLAWLAEEQLKTALYAHRVQLNRVAELMDGVPLDRLPPSGPERDRLRAILAELPGAGAYTVYDARGQSVLATGELPAAPDRRALAQFTAQATADDMVVGGMMGLGTPEVSLPISRRLLDGEGQVRGMVQASVRADYFSDFYKGLAIRPGSLIAVLRNDGFTVFRWPLLDNQPGRLELTNAVLQRQLRDAPAGVFRTKAPDGSDIMVAYRALKGFPLVIVTSVPAREVYAAWVQRSQRLVTMALLVAATFVVLGALGIRLSQRDRHRVTSLSSRLSDQDRLIQDVHQRIRGSLQVLAGLMAARSPMPAGLMPASPEAAAPPAMMPGDVDMAHHLRLLLNSLGDAHNCRQRGISLATAVEPLVLDLERALPVALLVDEAVRNSLAHAFPPGNPGRIELVLAVHEGQALLSIRDDGTGLPARKQADPASLGLRLMQVLADQLGGRLYLDGSEGTTVRLAFAV